MNIEINGATLQGDFMDADFMDVFEPALYKIRDDINNNKTKQHQSIAAAYKELNNCVEDFFNAIWGSDTSDRVFNGSKNVMVHLEAVASVEAAYREEKKQFNNLSNKYTQRQQNGFNSMQRHRTKQNKRT